MLRYLPYLLIFGLWLYTFVDCLGTPERDVRGPKVVWVLVILLFGEVLLGPIAWIVAGKHRVPAGAAGEAPAQGHGGHGGNLPIPEQPGTRWIAPDDNPEFLRSLGELNRRNRKDAPPSDSD
jgi:hypothetical protein